MHAPSHHLVVAIVILCALAGARLLAPPPFEPPARAPATSGRTSVPAVVDLNDAPVEALDALPGIGPATARAIVAGRPYRAVDELLRVRGIGAARLRALRRWVRVR